MPKKTYKKISETTMVAKGLSRKVKVSVIALFFIALLIGGFAGYSFGNPGMSHSTIIEEGSMTNEASYMIWQDGSTYYAKNGTTGEVANDITPTSNASQIILNAVTSLPDNSQDGKQGTIYFKNGLYNLDTTLTIPNYSRIWLVGESYMDAYALQWDHIYPTGGVVFRYTGTVNETSILYVPVSPNALYNEPHNMTTYISIENIGFRYSSRSYTGWALNLIGAYGFRLKNVVVDVEWNPNNYEPVSNSMGVYVPFTMNDRRILDNVVVFGYDRGFALASDHLTGTTITAFYCNTGVCWFAPMTGISIQYIHTLYCIRHIAITNEGGTGNVFCFFGAVEIEDTTSVWWIDGDFYGFYGFANTVLYGTIGMLVDGVTGDRRASFTMFNDVAYFNLTISQQYAP